jgi:hypothetical protein
MFSWKLPARFLALFLCLILPTSQIAFAAPKPLTPDQVRQRIQKIHVDGAVFIRETNGAEFAGRILSIDTDAFIMQTGNHPDDIVTVPYSDIVYMNNPYTDKRVWIVAGALVGTAIIGGLLLHHAYENSVANQQASQASFCQANKIPLSQCPGA